MSYEILLRKIPGPLVKFPEGIKGCLIVTQDTENKLGVVVTGLSNEDYERAILALQKHLEERKSWKPPEKETKEDGTKIIETYKFSHRSQGQHFAQEALLSGLPIKTR